MFVENFFQDCLPPSYDTHRCLQKHVCVAPNRLHYSSFFDSESLNCPLRGTCFDHDLMQLRSREAYPIFSVPK